MMWSSFFIVGIFAVLGGGGRFRSSLKCSTHLALCPISLLKKIRSWIYKYLFSTFHTTPYSLVYIVGVRPRCRYTLEMSNSPNSKWHHLTRILVCNLVLGLVSWWIKCPFQLNRVVMNWKKKIIITYNRKFDYKEAHYYYNLLYLHFFLNGTLCPRFEQTIYSVKISVKFVGWLKDNK